VKDRETKKKKLSLQWLWEKKAKDALKETSTYPRNGTAHARDRSRGQQVRDWKRGGAFFVKEKTIRVRSSQRGLDGKRRGLTSSKIDGS